MRKALGSRWNRATFIVQYASHGRMIERSDELPDNVDELKR